jgi:DivIVA domain-containing protein
VNQTALSRIDNLRVPMVKLGRGYDAREVDDFLQRLASELRAGRPVAKTVEDARFTPTKFRAGYEQAAIDDFLDQVVADSEHPDDRG